jgi:hypothetical protein
LEGLRPGEQADPPRELPFSDELLRRDFLDDVKEGRRPNADFEESHRSSTLPHLGNIATRVGQHLTFEGAPKTVRDDPKTAALRRRS